MDSQVKQGRENDDISELGGPLASVWSETSQFGDGEAVSGR